MSNTDIIKKAIEVGIDPTVDKQGNFSDDSVESMMGNVAEQLGFNRDSYNPEDIANVLSEMGNSNSNESGIENNNEMPPSQGSAFGYRGSRIRDYSEESGIGVPGSMGMHGPIRHPMGIVSPNGFDEDEEDFSNGNNGSENGNNPDEQQDSSGDEREKSSELDMLKKKEGTEEDPDSEKIDNSKKADDKKLNLKRIKTILILLLKIGGVVLIFGAFMFLIFLIIAVFKEGGKASMTETPHSSHAGFHEQISGDDSGTFPDPAPAPVGDFQTGFCNGNIYDYLQSDSRWAGSFYGAPDERNSAECLNGEKSCTISARGCGPTALANILSYYLGKQILPPEVADIASSRGHYVIGGGSSTSLYVDVANYYGLHAERITISKENITNNLKNCIALIISVRAGTFNNRSSSGHLVALMAINESNEIRVSDPSGKSGWYSLDFIYDHYFSPAGTNDFIWRFSK